MRAIRDDNGDLYIHRGDTCAWIESSVASVAGWNRNAAKILEELAEALRQKTMIVEMHLERQRD